MRKTFRKKKPQIEKKETFRYNDGIQAANLRVIDNDGSNLGVIPLQEALAKAQEQELDLVEVSPQANPPVARIIDYGKFKYQQEKQAQKQKLKQKKTDVKGVRLTPRIGAHDLAMRKKRVLKFLSDGDKVKIELILRGREHQHTSKAKEALNKFIQSIKDEKEINIEQDIIKQGGRLSAIVVAKK